MLLSYCCIAELIYRINYIIHTEFHTTTRSCLKQRQQQHTNIHCIRFNCKFNDCSMSMHIVVLFYTSIVVKCERAYIKPQTHQFPCGLNRFAFEIMWAKRVRKRGAKISNCSKPNHILHIKLRICVDFLRWFLSGAFEHLIVCILHLLNYRKLCDDDDDEHFSHVIRKYSPAKLCAFYICNQQTTSTAAATTETNYG